jgi:hypothetical protein
MHPKIVKYCSCDKKFKTRFQGHGPHRIHRMVDDKYDAVEKSFQIPPTDVSVCCKQQ